MNASGLHFPMSNNMENVAQITTIWCLFTRIIIIQTTTIWCLYTRIIIIVGIILFFPQVSVIEDSKQIIVYADLPGVKKENIRVDVSAGRLNIQGMRQTIEETQGANINYFLDERFYGKFSRSIKLPRNVKENGISAKYSEGVLQLTLPIEGETRQILIA